MCAFPQISMMIETSTSKLGCNSRLLQDVGGEGGCNESNIMVCRRVINRVGGDWWCG